MPRSRYFQPVSIVAGANQAPLRLAGRADLGFFQVKIAERIGEGVTRTIVGAADLRSYGVAHERLTGRRAPFAGLSMDRPRLMGIVNVTPDSFSDGGRFSETDAAVAHALKLVEEGADIVDIGGESTRPGADPVALDEELRRVIPVIETLRKLTDTRISVDTRKAEVMRQAADAGADILNDVSALTHDPAALETAARTGLPVVLMHAQGDPRTMNDNPVYRDVVLDSFDFLEQRIAACDAAGIPRERIVADPGIGFGKHLHHNVSVMAALSLYHGLGVPILLGVSRKKIIGQLGDVRDASQRLSGSLAAVLAGAAQGVQLFRVHDVAETRQALSVWQAVVNASPGSPSAVDPP